MILKINRLTGVRSFAQQKLIEKSKLYKFEDYKPDIGDVIHYYVEEDTHIHSLIIACLEGWRLHNGYMPNLFYAVDISTGRVLATGWSLLEGLAKAKPKLTPVSVDKHYQFAIPARSKLKEAHPPFDIRTNDIRFDPGSIVYLKISSQAIKKYGKKLSQNTCMPFLVSNIRTNCFDPDKYCNTAFISLWSGMSYPIYVNRENADLSNLNGDWLF